MHSKVIVTLLRLEPRFQVFPALFSALSLAFGLLLVPGIQGEAHAATYYVSQTGSDSNSGSSSQPFQTIQHAANIVGPGDTVIVENGTYSNAAASGAGSTLVNVTRGGTPGNYVTFMAQNHWGAVLDGLSNTTAEGWEIGADYVRVQGFEIKGFSDTGVSNYRGGQFLDIVHNKIHDIGRYCTDTSTGRDGIFLSQSNVVVEQNEISNIGRYAPGENGCTSLKTKYYQNHDHGLYLDGASYITVMNNIFYNNVRGWNIQIYGTMGGAVNSGLFIVNNTFANPNPWKVGHIIIANPVSGMVIANNIFYQPTTDAIHIDTTDGGSVSGGLSISHNLTTNAMADLNGGSTDPAVSGVTYTSNIKGTDPQFVSSSTKNFYLMSSSPAIDAGLTMSNVTNDFLGNKRPMGTGFDIGAYEFMSASSCTASSTSQ